MKNKENTGCDFSESHEDIFTTGLEDITTGDCQVVLYGGDVDEDFIAQVKSFFGVDT